MLTGCEPQKISLDFSPFQRWQPAVPASADGGNRRDEAGADQSHCQLHRLQTQPLRERHEGESPVRYLAAFSSTTHRNRLDSSLNEQDWVRGLLTNSTTGRRYRLRSNRAESREDEGFHVEWNQMSGLIGQHSPTDIAQSVTEASKHRGTLKPGGCCYHDSRGSGLWDLDTSQQPETRDKCLSL